MRLTDVMMKEKKMLPAVSMRDFPAGYWRTSTLRATRLQRMRVMLESGSKIESAIVVKRERELEEIAP